MNDGTKRKVSPRAPSIPLDEAITKTIKMYEEEGRHAAPAEVALKHLGYKSRNGASISVLASLGYWGLVERPKDGMVMVTKAFEDYQFTPSEDHKQDLLIDFLRTPPLFSSLLDQYGERLPSDATLKYDLIQRGFIPSTAENCMAVFKRSAEFARYFDRNKVSSLQPEESETPEQSVEPAEGVQPMQPSSIPSHQATDAGSSLAEVERQVLKENSFGAMLSTNPAVDRIPVRLAGGRRAWLEIPMPFFSADKKRLKRHIDLLLTDDEDELENEETE